MPWNHQADNKRELINKKKILIYSFPFIICLTIVACKTLWNQRLQTNFHGIKYINLIYIYFL